MNFFKQLSTKYYKDEKKLGYTWIDLVKKATRQKVIRKVTYLKFTKAIKKAKKDSIKQAVRDAQFQQKMDEIERVHKKIMKKQTKTKIKRVKKALKGYTKSFEISIKNNKDPLSQLQNTRKAIENHIKNILESMKGIKFVETLKVTFTKMVNNNIVNKAAYFNSKPQNIINNVMISESLKLSKDQILNIIAQWISEGSGWTIESVYSHYINIVQYEPMKGSSYIKLQIELRNSKKGLINIKNEDNECFRWCHIRHLNPQDKDSQRIRKSDKEYINRLDYSGIEFPVTTKQYNKIEKQNEININVFGYENKQPYPIFVSKEKYKNQINLLLITENENKHYVLIKNISTVLRLTKQSMSIGNTPVYIVSNV